MSLLHRLMSTEPIRSGRRTAYRVCDHGELAGECHHVLLRTGKGKYKVTSFACFCPRSSISRLLLQLQGPPFGRSMARSYSLSGRLAPFSQEARPAFRVIHGSAGDTPTVQHGSIASYDFAVFSLCAKCAHRTPGWLSGVRATDPGLLLTPSI